MPSVDLELLREPVPADRRVDGMVYFADAGPYTITEIGHVTNLFPGVFFLFSSLIAVDSSLQIGNDLLSVKKVLKRQTRWGGRYCDEQKCIDS